MHKPLKVAARCAPWLVIFLMGTGRLPAQPPPQAERDVCRGDASLQGMPIHSVRVETRGGWQPLLQLPFAPGDRFDFPKLSVAFDIVRKALGNDPLRDSFESSGQGSLSFIFVSSCVKVLEGAACGAVSGASSDSRCVDVVIRPYSLRLDLVHMGGNAIPVPRSNRGTFYSQVPASLRAFNPTFGLRHDRETGVSEAGAISTDLLTLPAMLRGQTPKERDRKLNLDLQGSKSLNEPFYETDSDLTLLRRQTGKVVEDLSLSAGFSVNQQPLAEGRHFNNAARVGGGLKLRPEVRGVGTLTLGGNYRWTGHRFFNQTQTEVTGEHSFEGRALVEGRVGDGIWRAGVWLDANAPEEKTFEAYRRLAFLGGYQSELGKTEQTVGLELLLGAGRAWGNLPAYARFYGGSGLREFLYDTPDAPTMQALPTGPLLRSFGRAQAGAGSAGPELRGGTSYWHVNLNVTVPLRKLSCPLIPAIALFDNDVQNAASNLCQIRRPPAGVKTLKDSLNGIVRTGESFLIADITDELVAQGMDVTAAENEAEARAAKVFRQIRPAMHYITEKANLYALKPLFMLDVGRVNAAGIDGERTRVALGGGVQVMIAIAKFELGYLRTIRRLPLDSRGNFFARIVFQNLF